MEIKLAEVSDMDDILELLKKNHADYVKDKSKGFVTTNITREQLKRLIEDEKGVTIAKEDGKVYAFAFAASWQYWSEWPFFRHMIEVLGDYTYNGEKLTTENSYQYGPVCVDENRRGEGIFEKVFDFSLKSMERFPIMLTFINEINEISYKSHTKKVSLDKIGEFDFNNNHYFLMGCMTKR